MNDIWDKIGTFLGHMLAMTIVVVTLKVIWFTLFRILL